MMNLKRMLPRTMILLVCLASCASAEVQTWTLRADGRVRASQRKEDFSATEFIEKINASEGKDYAVVIAPSGVKQLNDTILQLRADLRSCREGSK